MIVPVAAQPCQQLVLSVLFFNFSHLSGCVVALHCGFNLNFIEWSLLMKNVREVFLSFSIGLIDMYTLMEIVFCLFLFNRILFYFILFFLKFLRLTHNNFTHL